MNKLVAISIGLVAIFVTVQGHGRLRVPASTGSLWRDPEFEQYNPPKDFDDNAGYCGGFWQQYGVNEGRCGICGDAYDLPSPRPHEGGGTFGRGIITANYTAGQEIDVSIELTKSHLGYFEFRLCPHNNPLSPATQECLDQYVLPLADGTGTQYPIPTYDDGWHTIRLRLPEGVTCRQCVLQWHYRVGNSVGECEDGAWRMGCGDQETFRACADIAIN
ncbi:hypothetical protein Ocin01_06883 [Orchesella cincta]|uniref:Chitin-binding type-4 domain-containing protein n=1 Tax=Orchesella cincta TaxID=48709 RepID=A0A1D2N3D3_ORCCI|nr:hypothetical protein Ocin01_06883 [Orchesella cincta]